LRRSLVLPSTGVRKDHGMDELAELITEGRRRRGTGEWDAAVLVFTRAHALAPTVARPLVERGAILILQACYDESLADYEAARELDPDYPGLASYFAELYLYTDRVPEALALSRAAAVREPGDLVHKLNIAHAQLLLGHTEAARDSYARLAGEYHPAKRRSGAELARADLRLLVEAGVVVPDLEQVAVSLDRGRES
jgi:tetratricopeptide (TPR) repeat protein